MKVIFSAISAALLVLVTFAQAEAEVYVEYSQAMVEALRDRNVGNFVGSVIDGESLLLYSGGRDGGAQVRVQEPGIGALLRCYGQDRLDDHCAANDMLERTPLAGQEPSFADLRDIIAGIHRGGVVFTSYTRDLEALRQVLSTIRRPFHLLHFRGMLFLSFAELEDTRFLVGAFPFSRTRSLPFCTAQCRRNGREVALREACFGGRLPGLVDGIDFLYPKPPPATGFLACPLETSPPTPAVRPDLSKLIIPTIEPRFYDRLAPCLTSHGLPRFTPAAVDGVLMEIVLRVSRASREPFASLPQGLRQLLAALAGENEELYPEPVQMHMPARFLECR